MYVPECNSAHGEFPHFGCLFARDKHKDCGCNGHLITAREYDRITEREGVSEKLQRCSTNLSRVSEVKKTRKQINKHEQTINPKPQRKMK